MIRLRQAAEVRQGCQTLNSQRILRQPMRQCHEYVTYRKRTSSVSDRQEIARAGCWASTTCNFPSISKVQNNSQRLRIVSSVHNTYKSTVLLKRSFPWESRARLKKIAIPHWIQDDSGTSSPRMIRLTPTTSSYLTAIKILRISYSRRLPTSAR